MCGHTKCQNIPNDHYQHVCWVHILTFWVENLSLIVIKLFWCISYCFFNLYGTQKHQNSCFSVSCVSIKIYQMITTSMYVGWIFWFFNKHWFFDSYKWYCCILYCFFNLYGTQKHHNSSFGVHVWAYKMSKYTKWSLLACVLGAYSDFLNREPFFYGY